jgi:hypothetical protein
MWFVVFFLHERKNEEEGGEDERRRGEGGRLDTQDTHTGALREEKRKDRVKIQGME